MEMYFFSKYSIDADADADVGARFTFDPHDIPGHQAQVAMLYLLGLNLLAN